MQPWTPSPDEQPRDQWGQPPPGGPQPAESGGYLPDPEEYDQPTGFQRHPGPARGDYPQPAPVQGEYTRPAPGVYGRPAEPYGRPAEQPGVYGRPTEQRRPASGVYGRPVDPRQDSWAERRRHDEWLDTPHGGRQYDEPPFSEARQALPVPHQQTPVSLMPQAPPSETVAGRSRRSGSGVRGRRAEVRSRSGRSRHEREHSSKRTLRTTLLGGGLCLVLLLAGLGYWFFGPQDNAAEEDVFIPGATVAGLMQKVKADGFTCLPPGATFARCTKQVRDVEFSVTLNFAPDNRVSRITANGGTGVQNEVKVTDKELRLFFAMASQLPFAEASSEAGSWVDTNLRKDARVELAGVTYETAKGQDLLTMYSEPGR